MTGMVVHGLATDSVDWEDRVFGVAPSHLGRATRAVQLVMSEYPAVERMYFGSGKVTREQIEGEYTIEFLLDNFSRLRDFEAFQDAWRWSLNRLKDKINRIARPVKDSTATNTYGELRYTIPHFHAIGIRRVVLVSDPAHIGRCMIHALDVVEKTRQFGEMHIVAEHSGMMSPGQKAANVVCFEPPPGDPKPIGVELKRTFGVQADQMANFRADLSALYEKYGA